MAINSFEKTCDKIQPKNSSNNTRGCALADGSITSGDGKSNVKRCNILQKSPYLAADNVQLLSKVTEKKVVHKQAGFVSSFPLAVNIYKANSDEFKSYKKGNKKVKKSVLTLPNVPAEIPQSCTVSDMNDTEYYDSKESRKLRPKIRVATSNKKCKVKNKDYEFYDRDARYCSQMNINLDASSTDIIKYNGDYKNTSSNKNYLEKLRNEEDFNAHDVWTMLRNMNRFQFRPSPPMSQDSIPISKKKKPRNKKRNIRKDSRVIETCRTEEFSYISSYEFDSKSRTSFSASSSFDRITVIDKQDEYNQICKQLEKSSVKTKNMKVKNRMQCTNKMHGKKFRENNAKAIMPKVKQSPIENQHFIKDEKVEIEPSNVKDEKVLLGPQQQNEIDKPANTTEINSEVDTCKDIFSGSNITALNSSSINKSKRKFQKKIKAKIEGEKRAIKKNQQFNKESEAKVKTDNAKCKAVSLSPQDNKDLVTKQNIPSDKSNTESIMEQSKEMSGTLYSGSSRAALETLFINRKENTEKLIRKSSEESSAQLEGITKVIFSRNQMGSSSRNKDIQKRNPNLTAAEPKRAVNPRLTQTEIKRRLANLKFPIVILGKDELGSSSVQVMDYEPPHLEILKQKIWPFMQEWLRVPKQGANETNCKGKESNNCKAKQATLLKTLRKSNNETITNKSLIKDKNKCIKHHDQQTTEIANVKPHSTKKKTGPIHQLKDKMLKLLYKNNSVKEDVDEQSKNTPLDCEDKAVHLDKKQIPTFFTNKVDACTETVHHEHISSAGLTKTLNSRPEIRKSVITGNSKMKGTWANDFIENVIRKIRSGIYYNEEIKVLSFPSTRDASAQTVLFGKNIYIHESINEEKNKNEVDIGTDLLPHNTDDCLDALTGFDESISPLEIEIMNIKEVAVKHCATNVMVHFDVNLAEESQQFHPILEKATSFVPISVTKSQTKIFKCKTTILNAMLPAEICSILPRMMKNIIDVNKFSQLPMITTYQNDSPLYTITELTPCQSKDVFKPALLTNTCLSPSLWKLTKGIFSNRQNYRKIGNTTKLISFKNSYLTDILPKCLPTRLLMPSQMNTLAFIIPKAKIVTSNVIETSPKSAANCTALQVYKAPPSNVQLQDCVNKNFGKCGYLNILEQLWNENLSIRFKISTYLGPLEVNIQNESVICTLKTVKEIDCEEKCGNSELKLEIDSVYNGLIKRHKPNEISLQKTIEYKKDKGKKKDHQTVLNLAKTRKNKFVKLYRKSKSTSNISGEKCSTSLSKITNLDEFFQAMGSGKIMSSIFDGKAGKKIMSSITEMKNWISEISQRQAMLVILLTNKKDTPNLVRFRPVILQGIAVNRITRASELDMEIEVIQRENFNTMSEYEGIQYLPETVENHENLLEELYWIAKTTASDYQKPFNEASEKLLKSLLEKRKKLNPSYLRVMARYVGLGLLKTPNKY